MRVRVRRWFARLRWKFIHQVVRVRGDRATVQDPSQGWCRDAWERWEEEEEDNEREGQVKECLQVDVITNQFCSNRVKVFALAHLFKNKFVFTDWAEEFVYSTHTYRQTHTHTHTCTLLYFTLSTVCTVQFHGACNSSVSGGSENKKEERKKNVREEKEAGWY